MNILQMLIAAQSLEKYSQPPKDDTCALCKGRGKRPLLYKGRVKDRTCCDCNGTGQRIPAEVPPCGE